MNLGIIKTLFLDRERTQPLFPRTKISAVSDDSGKGLEAILAGLLKKRLDEDQYGPTLPLGGQKGDIFFKQVDE